MRYLVAVLFVFSALVMSPAHAAEPETNLRRCLADNECPDHMYCLRPHKDESGTCHVRPLDLPGPECTSDSECLEGQVCTRRQASDRWVCKLEC